MEKKVVVFGLSEGKKHSVCFKTTQADAAVTSLYLMRTAFAGEAQPKKIKVTIEEAE